MDNIPPSIIRQPSSPLITAARKEGKINPEMVGGNNLSTRTYYLKSCKRKSLTDIESLPDEVLLEVIVRLPAQDIYDSARLICSKWYHMTHTRTFIYTHLQHSIYGLLFQSNKNKALFFMSVGESGRVEISKNRYNELRYSVQTSCNRHNKHKHRNSVRTSCNGLLLRSREETNKKFYVWNPATRQIFNFRPLVGYDVTYELFAIGYAPATMEYKAVVLFTRGTKNICFILTIGVDNSWRTIGKESVSLAATQMFVNTPLITEGFMHWCHRNEVLTLNVETEIITETRGPTPEGILSNTYLSTGRYLTLLRPCGGFCWEVWEMKPKIDYLWRKVWDISLKAHKCSTFQGLGSKQPEVLIPIGWLKYLEILVFGIISGSIQSQVFVYNLLTHEIVTIELPARRFGYRPLVHKDSLVSLGEC